MTYIYFLNIILRYKLVTKMLVSANYFDFRFKNIREETVLLHILHTLDNKLGLVN